MPQTDMDTALRSRLVSAFTSADYSCPDGASLDTLAGVALSIFVNYQREQAAATSKTTAQPNNED